MSRLSWGNGPTQYFFGLTPDKVMNALEQFPVEGKKRYCTGYVQQLASFENRVYEVEFEDEPKNVRRVAKFYRPGRWTREQIQEEHDFMLDIRDAEIPVVTPVFFENERDTLRETAENIFYCIYPKVGGRQPEDLNPEQLMQLGRLIARMHVIGSQKKAVHRVTLNPDNYGRASLNFLIGEHIVSEDVEPRFRTVVEALIVLADEWFVGQPLQRIHGDCHAGNILWNEKSGPFFIDFDDMVNGPPIQDLWLLAPDPAQLKSLISGYRMMRDLPKDSVRGVEILRALRMIHYATWIAKRYDDPAFKQAFPQFESPKYWNDLTSDLEIQLQRILREKNGYVELDEEQAEERFGFPGDGSDEDEGMGNRGGNR
jgi:Ser/Thr protein kinase RdoA (MazF antagonist)